MRSSILKSLKPDIMVEMLENAFLLENWDKILNTSDILFSYAQCIYEERQDLKSKGLPLPLAVETLHPLVYYYGFSHLMCGFAHQKQGHYDQAREYIIKYADLGWFDDLGEEGLQLVEEFRFLAKTNLYTLDILAGKTDQLEEYVLFLQDYPEELLPGQDTVLQAVLRYDMNLYELLHAFAQQFTEFGESNDGANISYYYNYCYYLAVYHKRAGRHAEALECILQCIILAHKSHNNGDFRNCMALFQSLRDRATEVQIRQYQEVLTASLE
ncbi:DNA-binding protein [Paenibacillus sp. 19GGS1-52]|uniref:DNA-binding protein n=1 Tax=Paenibacillus sp. 19GGS1-52 TaxID=2758563 RepID=UPI001EFBE58F|nr:DNA-binding protein [Paenibacillus sp. 19GGS1-52]ULO07695.1 DNA-binding protein [Paenibacillus sp. 19GGS1-52]